MYLEYFGLDDYPFDGLPDRRFYYVGGAQHQSLGLLTTALSRSGSICVLSGSSGAGKTTLVKMLMRSLPRRMRIIAIDDPRTDPHLLLATILRASGVVATSFESVAELTLKLRQMLEKSIAMGIITTVICDEAQGLSDEVLEQIRLISNMEGDAGKMINFLLVGQEDLIANLNKPEHDMLKNRIKIFAMLPHLKEDEVASYISYRLQQASCVKPLFTNRAIRALTKKSNGIPRLINAIADMSLTLACSRKKKQVTAGIVNKASYLVQYKKNGVTHSVWLGIKEFFKVSFYQKLFTICLAAVLALGAFYGALYIMQHKYPLRSVEGALLSDQEINSKYQKVSSYLFRGRDAAGRELYYFNRAINQAYFKSEAFATLFKLHGYAVHGDNLISNNVLKKVNLQSLRQAGSFKEAISYNCPILIGLLDDNLTPFYAVLYQLNEDVANLIIGNYIFAVKLDYIKERYMGNYVLLHPYVGDLSVLVEEDSKAKKELKKALIPYLKTYLQKSLEAANREANTALMNLDNQKLIVDNLEDKIKLEVLNQSIQEGKTDEQIEQEADLRLAQALAGSDLYQKEKKIYDDFLQKSTQKELEVDTIRNISLKNDAGVDQAISLFLTEQNLPKLNARAVALLTIANSDMPNLINVVKVSSEVKNIPASNKVEENIQLD